MSDIGFKVGDRVHNSVFEVGDKVISDFHGRGVVVNVLHKHRHLSIHVYHKDVNSMFTYTREGRQGRDVWISLSMVSKHCNVPTSVPNKFKLGSFVTCIAYGKGVVTGVRMQDYFPIKAYFKWGCVAKSYTLEGKLYSKGEVSLFEDISDV